MPFKKTFFLLLMFPLLCYAMKPADSSEFRVQQAKVIESESPEFKKLFSHLFAPSNSDNSSEKNYPVASIPFAAHQVAGPVNSQESLRVTIQKKHTITIQRTNSHREYDPEPSNTDPLPGIKVAISPDAKKILIFYFNNKAFTILHTQAIDTQTLNCIWHTQTGSASAKKICYCDQTLYILSGQAKDEYSICAVDVATGKKILLLKHPIEFLEVDERIGSFYVNPSTATIESISEKTCKNKQSSDTNKKKCIWNFNTQQLVIESYPNQINIATLPMKIKCKDDVIVVSTTAVARGNYDPADQSTTKTNKRSTDDSAENSVSKQARLTPPSADKGDQSSKDCTEDIIQSVEIADAQLSEPQLLQSQADSDDTNAKKDDEQSQSTNTNTDPVEEEILTWLNLDQLDQYNESPQCGSKKRL